MYFDDGDENFLGFNSDEVTELSYFKFLCNLESLQGVRKGPFKNDVTQNFSTLTYCKPLVRRHVYVYQGVSVC